MTNSSAPTAAPNLPCREFPCNAPDHIDDDTDARYAWADGWNACLVEVKRRDGSQRQVEALRHALQNLLNTHEGIGGTEYHAGDIAREALARSA